MKNVNIGKSWIVVIGLFVCGNIYSDTDKGYGGNSKVIRVEKNEKLKEVKLGQTKRAKESRKQESDTYSTVSLKISDKPELRLDSELLREKPKTKKVD